ncbi:MAG: type II secretion system F family protein [Myxococcales bacterium]|nr:type II secretion system F family protein [Myxococcales bacterium]MDD9968212.1 type II secretion system F family protein [Myxococcales bacterium]
MTTDLLKLAAVGAMMAAIILVVTVLLTVKPTEPESRGLRGRKRSRARIHNSTFAFFEPAIRTAGGIWAQLPAHDWRAAIERDLQQAGYFLGIDGNEVLGMATLAGVAASAIGFGVGLMIDMPFAIMAFGLLMGPWMVVSSIKGERQRRFREVGRQLPGEIDLAALCMNAGMDMPGALSMLVAQGHDEDVIVEELGLVLQELELGRTRAAALRNFADRVPTEAVQEFVGAVVLAEEKGTPPAETMRIQAGMLRMRRSVLAEEAASRAGVLMMIPMMMLLGSILIILLGSMMLESYGSGFF